jgi:hypothetical protein
MSAIKGLFRRTPKHTILDERQIGMSDAERKRAEAEGKGGKWALFLLPFITVLREGLEAVIFVAGVRPLSPFTTRSSLASHELPLMSLRFLPCSCSGLDFPTRLCYSHRRHRRSDCRFPYRFPHLPRWFRLCPPHLPHHLHQHPLPRRSRSLFQGCWILRILPLGPSSLSALVQLNTSCADELSVCFDSSRPSKSEAMSASPARVPALTTSGRVRSSGSTLILLNPGRP